MRARRAALAFALAGLLAPASPSYGAVKPPGCLWLGFSPDFARDRTMFCQHHTAGRVVWLHRSVDSGRTWDAGRVVDDSGVATGIVVSPLFAQDRRVYLTTSDKGTDGFFESVDAGKTFREVPDSSHRELFSLQLYPYVEPLPAPHVALVHLRFGGGMSVYDSQLGFRPIVSSPWPLGFRFIVPPDYPTTRQAVQLGRQPSLTVRDVRLIDSGDGAYQCADFTCPRRIAEFGLLHPSAINRIVPGDEYFGGLDVRGDPPYEGRPYYMWRSRDYGRTWSRWASVEKLLNNRAIVPTFGELTVAASPDAPRRLFLHLVSHPEGKQASVPMFQLYRSDDDGASWRRIAHAWGAGQPTKAKSVLPWNEVGPEQRFGQIFVQPGGRLYVPAAHKTGGKFDFVGMYCSTDLGRTWRKGTC